MNNKELASRFSRVGAHNYAPLEIVLRGGQGAWLEDVEGKRYLDFLACYSAVNFGHQNPYLAEALRAQLGRLSLCSRAFHSEELILLSEELTRFCGMESVLLMNSGTEAVESALKLARAWAYKKKKVAYPRARILAFQNNFHGRTITVVSFSSEPLYRDAFGPFTPGFDILPYNSAHDVEKAITEDTVAILVEPIQAEAGILVPEKSFLPTLRTLCDQHGLLLMVDEIQTGLARTGKMFAFQHADIKPDVLILGKSLGGGLVPISAVLAPWAVMSSLVPGEHGSTFGGNPLACAAARAVLKLLQAEDFCQRACELGQQMWVDLLEPLQRLPHIRQCRGLGALLGIELDHGLGGARRFCEQLASEGILCKETHEHVIRLAPPLVMEKSDLKQACQTLYRILSQPTSHAG